jgi:uncharacterized membrane protein
MAIIGFYSRSVPAGSTGSGRSRPSVAGSSGAGYALEMVMPDKSRGDAVILVLAILIAIGLIYAVVIVLK